MNSVLVSSSSDEDGSEQGNVRGRRRLKRSRSPADLDDAVLPVRGRKKLIRRRKRSIKTCVASSLSSSSSSSSSSLSSLSSSSTVSSSERSPAPFVVEDDEALEYFDDALLNGDSEQDDVDEEGEEDEAGSLGLGYDEDFSNEVFSPTADGAPAEQVFQARVCAVLRFVWAETALMGVDQYDPELTCTLCQRSYTFGYFRPNDWNRPVPPIVCSGCWENRPADASAAAAAARFPGLQFARVADLRVSTVVVARDAPDCMQAVADQLDARRSSLCTADERGRVDALSLLAFWVKRWSAQFAGTSKFVRMASDAQSHRLLKSCAQMCRLGPVEVWRRIVRSRFEVTGLAILDRHVGRSLHSLLEIRQMGSSRRASFPLLRVDVRRADQLTRAVCCDRVAVSPMSASAHQAWQAACVDFNSMSIKGISDQGAVATIKAHPDMESTFYNVMCDICQEWHNSRLKTRALVPMYWNVFIQKNGAKDEDAAVTVDDDSEGSSSADDCSDSFVSQSYWTDTCRKQGTDALPTHFRLQACERCGSQVRLAAEIGKFIWHWSALDAARVRPAQLRELARVATVIMLAFEEKAQQLLTQGLSYV